MGNYGQFCNSFATYLKKTQMGANTIKGVTRCVKTIFKYNIISLKNHKMSIINWIFSFFPFLSSMIYKVSLFKTRCKLMMFQESFCMFIWTPNCSALGRFANIFANLWQHIEEHSWCYILGNGKLDQFH